MYLNIGQLTDYSKKLINAISRLERSVGSFSNVKNEKNDKFIFYNLILEGKSNAEAVATIATKSKEGIMLSFLET